MKRLTIVSIAGLLFIAAFAVFLPTPATAGTILSFERMVAVSGPFLGTANPIRSVPGGGLPWMITSGRGALEDDGHLDVQVEGLVLANDPMVPEDLRGVNPVGSFRAIVSCLSVSGVGSPTTVNVSTDNFPADTLGNSSITAVLVLPHPCTAPIVFVTSPTGSWFAASGS